MKALHYLVVIRLFSSCEKKIVENKAKLSFSCERKIVKNEAKLSVFETGLCPVLPTLSLYGHENSVIIVK